MPTNRNPTMSIFIGYCSYNLHDSPVTMYRPVTGVSANLFQHCRGSILAKQPKLIPLWFEGRWETEQCININQIMPIPMELQLFDSMG